MRLFLFLILFSISQFALADSPLRPIKTDSPRDTMKTFMDAMNKYREGVDTGNPKLMMNIDRAVRTLELNETVLLTKAEKDKNSAILLKEVIDRVIVIDFQLIPSNPSEMTSSRWRLKDTEIVIHRIQEGPRKGEFLFSAETVARANEFYEIVKYLPYLEGSGSGALYRSSLFEDYIPLWASQKTLSLYRWQWIGALIAIFLGLFIKRLTQIILEFSKKLTNKTKNDLDDGLIVAIEKPTGLIAATAIWYLSLKALNFDGIPYEVLSVVIQAVFSISVIWFFLNVTAVLTEKMREVARSSEFPLDDQLVPMMHKALRLFIVVFGTLVAIQNLGVNVMSLLAGLGLGGLAFALAAKDTAANFFGSIMILWDHPFKVGDWIKTSDAEGTVEEIGFRSTRIRTFYSSQVSIPNSKLANVNIDNMGRRQFRRIYTTLGVTYDTPPEKIEAFLEGLKNIIKANTHTRKDYFHVVFSGYGASSLDIMLYFFLEVSDWSNELVERQNIYLEILRLSKELGISFAFPTQTLHMETFPEKSSLTAKHDQSIDFLKTTASDFSSVGNKAKPEGLGIFTAPFRE